MIRTNNFQPTKYSPSRHSIGGKLAVAAKRGQIVRRKAGTTDELELATGTGGFHLTRDVVTAADAKAFHEADLLRENKGGFQTPFVVDGAVQAEDFAEVWVEGPDLLGAGMDNSVTVGTPLMVSGGKFIPLATPATNENYGVVRENIAAINHPGPARRFLIQITRQPKRTP